MDETLQAGWNSSDAFCKELSFIRRYLHEARLERNIDRQFDLLDSYFVALSSRMDEKKKIGKELQAKHDEYFITGKKLYREYQKSVRNGDPSFNGLILDFFRFWEMQLRKAENSLGLLIKEGDDPLNAL